MQLQYVPPGLTAVRRGLLLAAAAAGMALAHAGVLRALLELARTDASASHVLAIPLVSAALLFRERQRIASAARVSWLHGGAAVLAGLALHLAAASAAPGNQLSLRVGALVVLLLGVFILFYGAAAFRVVRFPLLFAAFTVPLPPAALDSATYVLKTGSAEAVALFYTLLGTTFHREGTIFALPGFVIEIADACSGIRSSLALALAALLAGHLFLRSTWAKSALLLAVLPVTILKNAVRIVLLTTLATHVDPEFLAGPLHQEGGIAFFVLALAMLVPVFSLVRRLDSRGARTASPPIVHSPAPFGVRTSV